jgi:NDP-sugar pyrophosphorylase family protein
MLLCAGKGTRLGTLSDERPKPLLPVCGIPVLRYGVAKLVASGITEIVINLHHRGELIVRELGDGSAMGAHIQYSHEEEILGTGGGLKRAADLLDPDGNDEPFLSMNGKLIFDLDIAALVKAYEEGPPCLGMMVVQPAPNAMKWGAVDVINDGGTLRVRNILGEGRHMFCGVHLTRPSVVRRLPEGEACMVRQGYLPWLQGGERVSAFEHHDGYFAEHSTPKRYVQSSIDLLGGATLRHPPGPLRGVDASARIDPSATIVEPVRICAGARVGAGATVGPSAVIGESATVTEGASVRESVVWKDATASGRIERAIVTPKQVVDATGADEVDG